MLCSNNWPHTYIAYTYGNVTPSTRVAHRGSLQPAWNIRDQKLLCEAPESFSQYLPTAKEPIRYKDTNYVICQRTSFMTGPSCSCAKTWQSTRNAPLWDTTEGSKPATIILMIMNRRSEMKTEYVVYSRCSALFLCPPHMIT